MVKQEKWGDVCQRVMTCALTGAAAFCAGIPGAQIIANGPLWCYFYALRHLEKVDPGIAERFNGTQPDNNAVVYGTEACLKEELSRRKKLPPASMLLIENSCAVSLIGDDVAGIAREVELPYPVVCLDSGGLYGGFAEGYSLTGLRCLECLGLAPRHKVELGTVNLLGLSPAYYNGANDVEELKRLLHMCGYKVLACPGAGSTVAEIRQLTQAEFNIVLNEELGLELAQFLQNKYGMPYKTAGLPFGCAGTLNWLETVCGREAVGETVRAEARAVTTKISKSVNELRLTWGEPWFDDIVVSAPATLALSLAMSLRREWFDTESLTVIEQGKAGSRDLAEFLSIKTEIDRFLVADEDDQEVKQIYARLQSGLLLGSSEEKVLLLQNGVTGVAFVPITYPVLDEILLIDVPFMGLRGALFMVQRLWNAKIACMLAQGKER